MWFMLALLAGFLFAANRLLVRSILTKKVDPMTFGAKHEIIAGAILLPIAFFSFSLPQSVSVWIAFALGILCIFLCDLFAFLCLEKIEASLYQIVGQLRHVIVLLGAYFLFTELITLSKIVSILLIIIGVSIALVAKEKIAINRGTIYTFLSTLFIALGFLFIKITATEVPPAFSGSISLLISGILISILLRFRKAKKSTVKSIGNRKALLLAAGIFAAFELSLFTALAIGEASRVTPVTQSSLIFTLLGGYFFLHERDALKQKVLGSLLIVVGIGILYFV
ncbi:MAG: DMT family transporter [Patescibacteria group bacterium]